MSASVGRSGQWVLLFWIRLFPRRCMRESWVYSVVKFELKKTGSETTVILDHTGFPEGDAESLGGGWRDHYWEPLKKYFAQSKH